MSTACQSQDFFAAQVKWDAATAGTGWFLLLRCSCDGDSQATSALAVSGGAAPVQGPSLAAAAATSLACWDTAGEVDRGAKLFSQAPA